VLGAAKAWVGLLGAVVTALLGLDIISVDGSWHKALTIIAAVCTAVLVYAVPNQPAVQRGP
jgi:hypothetical protein